MTEPTVASDAAPEANPREPIADGPAIAINEDWAATIVGLVLVVLVLAGLVTHGMLLGAVP